MDGPHQRSHPRCIEDGTSLTLQSSIHLFYNPSLNSLTLPHTNSLHLLLLLLLNSSFLFCFFLVFLATMAIDLVGFSKMEDEHSALQQAASAGLKSMEHLISLLSSHPAPQGQYLGLNHDHHLQQLDCSEIADFTVSKFKQVVSILNRTGHARFRRGPSHPPSSSSGPAYPVDRPKVRPQQPQTFTLDFAKPKATTSEARSDLSAIQFPKERFSTSPPVSSTTSSFISSITGDGSVSVSNGKLGTSLLVAPTTAFSAGKPPLSSSHRKKCNADHSLCAGVVPKISLSGRCHCSKRRSASDYPLDCFLYFAHQ